MSGKGPKERGERGQLATIKMIRLRGRERKSRATCRSSRRTGMILQLRR
jgi:hypothetical protein